MRLSARDRIDTLELALALDLAFGEPPTQVHPVVGMGSIISWLERRAPRRGQWLRFVYGLSIATGLPLALGLATHWLLAGLRRTNRSAWLLARAWLLKSTFSVRLLLESGKAVQEPLERGDLDGARAQLRNLVRRDPATLSREQVISAAMESLAESTVDSIVGPLWAYAVADVPGAVAYRAVNTLDSMLGYHGEYEWQGKASARVDDLTNLAPARLATALLVASAAAQGYDSAGAVRVAARDHARTESPNAGWPMSAMAGALGVRLEKPGAYALGDAMRPLEQQDIQRASQIVAGATLGAVDFLCLCIRREVGVGFKPTPTRRL